MHPLLHNPLHVRKATLPAGGLHVQKTTSLQQDDTASPLVPQHPTCCGACCSVSCPEWMKPTMSPAPTTSSRSTSGVGGVAQVQARRCFNNPLSSSQRSWRHTEGCWWAAAYASTSCAR